MRALLALAAAALFAGCAIPAATLESSSLAPSAPLAIHETGRLDAAHPEARLAIHVPRNATGVRFDLVWSSANENLAPHVTLLDLAGEPASEGGTENAAGGPQRTGYGGIVSGEWNAPPGDYLLRVGFPFAFPAGDAFDVTLDAGTAGSV